MRMRLLRLCGTIVLIVMAASCGGNNTKAGVSFTFPTTNPVSVLENGQQQFFATVSGVSTTTVYWQVCLPAASSTVEPTICTPIPAVTISGQTPLTGYGTITQGGLYTAPGSIPSPNNFVIMATATVDTTEFAVFSVSVGSSVQVAITPATASILTGEHFQFSATVSGATNTNVTWSVDGTSGGDATDGYVCPSPAAPQPCTAGEYFAPIVSPGAVTVTATSVQDPSVSAPASLTVVAGVAPTFTIMDPTTVAQGSVQQDVYVTGNDIFNTTSLQIGGVTLPSTAITFISSTLMRATIPASVMQQPGSFLVNLVEQNGDLSGTSGNLSVIPMRPALVALTPDTVSQVNSSTNFSLTGGFYVLGKTVAELDGSSTGMTTSYIDTRHLTVSVPSGGLSVPGLHPLVLQNGDAVTAGVPSMTAKNVAVTPNPASIATAPNATVTVGASPSAVAIDYATGYALVANTGEGTVSVVNPATGAVVGGKISVGNSPTGIAVDDLISPPLALVVNSTDQTVSAIDLATMEIVGQPLSVALSAATPPNLPFSVGINPMTHRAVVTYQNSDEAAILDISSGAPVLVEQITNQNLAMGQNPAVAVDPRLNWAVVTPGGSGIGVINIIDLGRNAVPGVDGGREPQLLYTAQLTLTNKILGVGLNSETHQILLTDPSEGFLTSFNLMNTSVTNITFTNDGVTLNELGFVAAAVNPFANIGIAVNSDGTAVVADLANGIVLQNVSGLGSMPAAVAIDPASNEAVVANQGDGTVSIISLGSLKTPQILESSPPTTLTMTSPLALTITGSGFTSGSTVRLDQVAVATSTVASSCTPVPAVCRQLTATVPASMLGSARRFMVDVLNADSTVSNVTDLSVIQAVIVGTTPAGVAVDTDRDLAAVTNLADGTVSLVALSPLTPVFGGGTAGAVGTIGSPILAGGTPLGVAILPRLGLAAVADSTSNSVTIVDVTGTIGPSTGSLCATCESPVGVAVNGDTGQAAVTNDQPENGITEGTVSMIGLANGGTTGANIRVDQDPTGIAIDPGLNFAGVAASQTGSVDIVNIPGDGLFGPGRLSSISQPVGVDFDSLNQVFLVTTSLNTVIVVDPSLFTTTSMSVGINPTSVEYDFQASSLLTVNAGSNTISELDYDCPAFATTIGCSTPQVRATVSMGSPPVLIGPNAIAIDPKLDIAVIVDPANNRILLVPMPH